MANCRRWNRSSSQGSRRRRGPSAPRIWSRPAAATPRCGSGWNSCWKPTRKRRIFWPNPPSIATPSRSSPSRSWRGSGPASGRASRTWPTATPTLADQIRELLPALVMVEKDLTIDPDPGSNGPQAPPAPAPGVERRLGDYRILREIGRGGMGVVYEAEQVSLGRQVALKVLPSQVAEDRLALERFRREAKSAARLHHSNIVPVFEVGRDGEVAYYAMQFIEGQGLDKVIDELARLRDPGRKPGVAQGLGPTAAAAAPGAGEPALGRIAESLLNGRFATEGAVPSADILPAAVTGPAATERLARDADHTLGFRPRGS